MLRLALKYSKTIQVRFSRMQSLLISMSKMISILRSEYCILIFGTTRLSSFFAPLELNFNRFAKVFGFPAVTVKNDLFSTFTVTYVSFLRKLRVFFSTRLKEVLVPL